MTRSAGLFALALVLSGPALAQSQSDSDAIRARINAIFENDFGCTRTKRAFRKLRKDYPQFHFAFAGRKAVTITGIKGCGYAWDTDPETARTRAMVGCKRQERKLGTGPKGNRTCHFMD